MATHDYVLANQSGSSFRSDLNNALSAIVSQNSSATAPATTFSYQYWVDTSVTPALLKQRNAANDAWITLAEIGGQVLLVDGTNAKPGLSFASDTDTGFKRNEADDISLVTGGIKRLTVKSDGDVGIGTDSPDNNLHVIGIGKFESTGTSIQIDNGTEVIGFIGNDSGNLFINAGGTNDTMKLQVAGNERLRLTDNGTTRINGNTDSSNFRVVNSGELYSLPTYNNTNTNTDSYVRVNNNGVFQRISSSRRYKDNITSIDAVGGLDVVTQLVPRQWIDHSSGEQVSGLVAEEVHAAGASLGVVWGPYNPNTPQNDSTPETRDGSTAAEGDEIIEAVNDRGLIMHLIQAIKDLKAENDALKTRIETLEAAN
jgi:hypothetical protein